MQESVLYEVAGQVATITMNRPEVANSVDGSMHAGLIDGIRRADADPDVRVMIITGAGRFFCAGIDLAGGMGGDDTDAAPTRRGARALQMTPDDLAVVVLWNTNTPAIAALNGSAAGFGMDLALACDIRLAATTAKLAPGFVDKGLSPPESGGTWLLPRVAGYAKAAEMLFTGDKLDADALLAAGIVSQVVEPDELAPAARAVADRIAANAPLSMTSVKRMLRAGQREGFAEHCERLFLAVMHSMDTDDCAEGVSAFIEKRPPRFTGR